MNESEALLKPTQSLRIEMELSIQASQAKVWKALTEDVHLWWRDDFRAVPDSRMVMETRVGGGLYEEAPDGSFGTWYTVTGLRPGQSLNLVGHISPPFGGPTISMLWLRLEEASEGTVTLRLTDALLGPLDQEFGQATEEGWKALMGALKDYAEKASPDSAQSSKA